jgi:hypothetical protein
VPVPPFPRVPRLTNDQIRQRAEEFLSDHHPGLGLPVPIEEIVEFSLEIEIRPVRRLRHRFEVDGFLSADLSLVVVDEDLMTRLPSRYCFTLAHEVGHRVLHATQIQWTRAATPDE